eukprot:1196144-Prorocentrum_minimum.AAC.1
MPHPTAVRLTRWLTHQRPQLKNHYDQLLKRLLNTLDDAASAAREKVLKSLSVVLDSDMEVLMDENVQAAVERRLSDGAITVRGSKHWSRLSTVGKKLGRPTLVEVDSWSETVLGTDSSACVGAVG